MMIKMIVLDVDGSMTDGSIVVSSNGVETKTFNVKDGHGIKEAIKNGIIVSVITGRSSYCVEKRAEELGISDLFQGVQHKTIALDKLITKYSLNCSEIAYFGDDVNDMECMERCGFTGSPRDAVIEVQSIVDFVSIHNGGHGAVRDFIDYIIKNNEKEQGASI